MKITGIETIRPARGSALPILLFVRIHTDEGIVGLGETAYVPEACAAVVHSDLASDLIGEDPLDIERHWDRYYGTYSRMGANAGAEIRALSAIDVALWDILGQAAGLPIWAVLGGKCRDRQPTYNTCAGPGYTDENGPVRPGVRPRSLKKTPEAERYDDLDWFLRDAGSLAEDLLSEGLTAMKLWPFDAAAKRHGGLRIEQDDLRAALEPLRKIREAVGDRMRIMIEGHGLWQPEAALRVARALEEYDVFWAEDLIVAHDPAELATLRSKTTVPLCASEHLTASHAYKRLLEADAADFVMIDPTWTGGITESRKIASLAHAYGRPVTYHDCTGPVTYMAGVHLSLSQPNAVYQESVRGQIHTAYRECVTALPPIVDGEICPPERPGLGIELKADWLQLPHTIVTSGAIG